MAALTTPTDIANSALQKCGVVNLIAAGALLTEDSERALVLRTCYDPVRRRELRRNVWRTSIRRTVLRPYQTASNIVGSTGKANAGATMSITFGNWAVGTAYAQSDVVVGSDGHIYIAQKATTGNDPTLPTSFPYWTLYFGPDVAQEYVTIWVSTITYAIGNNVIGSDGNSYQSIVNNNLNHNPVGDGGSHWVAGSATATKAGTNTNTTSGFFSGETMYVGANLYLSLVNGNTVDPTTNVDNVTGATFANSWLQMTTPPTLAQLNFIYPIGTGPLSQQTTLNVFRLPVGFMRAAPQQPKAGSYTVMGAPTNLGYTDWEYDDGCIVSSTTAIILRFAADVQDTTQFDPMFVDGFSAALALEAAPGLRQSEAQVQVLAQGYAKFMGQAREVNAIEQGPTEQALDDFLACRY